MLSTLRIKNIAIVDELVIEFRPGLNVLTGETGAGKSIVLRSLELLVGDPGNGRKSVADFIRTGCDRAELEGLFEYDSAAAENFQTQFDGLLDESDENQILIRRVIDSKGKSKFTLNGRLVTRGQIQQLGPYLLESTGQHEQQRLLDENEHRILLDDFGIPEKLLTDVESLYLEYSRLEKRLATLKKDKASQEEYFRRLQFENEELSGAELKSDEREFLESEIKRLSHAQTIASELNGALNSLDSDREDFLPAQLVRLRMSLEKCARFDARLSDIIAFVASAEVQISEARLSLAKYLGHLEHDPDSLDALSERLSELARLERKYGKSIPELIAYAAQIADELSEYASGAFDEEKLEAELGRLQAQLQSAEKELTKARTKAAKKLEGLVEKELLLLGMKQAKFNVELSPSDSSSHGADRVSFLLAANPGEKARGLSQVASGGELSRVLLVLKTILSDKRMPLLQIFDEVDVGVGGAVAHAVGEKLRAIAKKGQVLVVTHAPQIAALGDAHFAIAKTVSSQRTKVGVSELSEETRVREIARMLAGKKITGNFEHSARELLKLSA